MDAIQDISPASSATQSEPVAAPSPINIPTGKVAPAEEKKQSSGQSEERPKVDVKKIVKAYNSFVKNIGTKLSFVQDDASGRVVILVKDQDSGKVIRQIPSKEMLELLAKMKNLEGMIFNKEG
ncbi:MAG: flagellar protein FlaG [FCB group bacterium]|nr:flagellar protein FlaG [FCB group bacterium]